MPDILQKLFGLAIDELPYITSSKPPTFTANQSGPADSLPKRHKSPR